MAHTVRFWPEGRREGCGPYGKRDAGQGRQDGMRAHSDIRTRRGGDVRGSQSMLWGVAAVGCSYALRSADISSVCVRL